MVTPQPRLDLPELASERLRFRAVNDGDVDDIFQIYSDREALEYFAREPMQSRDDAMKMVRGNLLPSLDEKALAWAICLADSDRMIGTFTLFHIDLTNRRAEVGYILNRKFWGKGYASEALQRIIRYCFDDLEFGRLEADVDPANHGSLKLLERHGFEREGYFRRRWFMRGAWYDSVMFGLLNPAVD